MSNTLTEKQEKVIKAIKEYDTTPTIEVTNTEDGVKVHQRFYEEQELGIFLFLPNSEEEKAGFNYGVNLDREYLANICDFLIELLKSEKVEVLNEGDLYLRSKNHRQAYVDKLNKV